MAKRQATAPALQMTDAARPVALSPATRHRVRVAIGDPEARDSVNPTYLFSTTATDLLLAIVGGLVDPVQLAHEQLANRGLDLDGQWCGFDRAREIHGVAR